MTYKHPLVSIGMAVYNGEKSISRAVDSILDQTYQNLEVIISDNASTDSTAEICLEYAARDPRIRYHRNAVNIGVTENYRLVFKLSSGEYFMWAAVDDVKPRTVVENCLSALINNHCAVVAHGPILLRVPGQNDLLEVSNQMEMDDLGVADRIRTFTNRLTTQCILYSLHRRSALANCIFPACYGQEYLLYLQMCVLGSFEYVRAPIVIYTLKKPDPPTNPMYADVPIRLNTLLTAGPLRRWKCWTVLLAGCYYLISLQGARWGQRRRAIVAHFSSFTWVYRARLAKEVVFQLFLPAGWVANLVWRLAGQHPASLRLARQLRVMLARI